MGPFLRKVFARAAKAWSAAGVVAITQFEIGHASQNDWKRIVGAVVVTFAIVFVIPNAQPVSETRG